jgi:hypothetical protein
MCFWDTSDIEIVFVKVTTARVGVGFFYVNTIAKIFTFYIWEL